ncbi:DUF2497 domain-containing protein [Lichenicoccus sp.]|uniref:DUF2497 domain-containing protein n=1 Tax=Lichenicoccus sp. TaxID=2781899 RepID=UPI003D128856
MAAETAGRPAVQDGDEDGSMDTILASIRRILNEDEVSPAETAPSRPPEARPPEARPPEARPPEARPNESRSQERAEAKSPEPGPRDDVLVLKETMMVPPEKIEPAALVESPAAKSPADAGPPAAASTIEGLIAARTRAATAQSFDALHEALSREEPAPVSRGPALLRAGGPTLEDLVRDELRGLLSSWLDVHLPGLVETLVRSEIEKLTRRG